MIECELCGGFFDADDIETCPECGMELCPACYEKHVSLCIAGDFDSVDEVFTESIVPHECPRCGQELQLDVDPDGSARVYCEKCGYIKELNDKEIAELNDDND